MKFILAFIVAVIVICSDAKKSPPKSLEIGTKKEGDCSRKANNGDSVTVHYTGFLFDTNKVFDSSVERGDPFTFTLGVGQVIKGWDSGVLGMCLGEKRRLRIPSDLAYGEHGSPPVIPGNAALVFDVELLDIGDADKHPAHFEDEF